jgi:hypothetical protein
METRQKRRKTLDDQVSRSRQLRFRPESHPLSMTLMPDKKFAAVRSELPRG